MNNTTNNFSAVKKYAENINLTPDLIVSALKLFEYAEDNNTEFYINDNNKLSMRVILSNNKSNYFGDNDALNNLKNMFGMK